MSDITPSPELVQQWKDNWVHGAPQDVGIQEWLVTKATRWGADIELEACVEWLADDHTPVLGQRLRAARRPKPPSPKEEALQVLENLLEARRIVDPEYQALRHALEQLDD